MQRLALPVVLVLALAASAAPAARPSLEGRWRLADQTYEQGRANQADLQVPLILEIVREGTSLKARIHRGAGSTMMPWPAAVSLSPDPAATALHIDAITIDPARGILAARYRAGEETEGIVLHVTEEYAMVNSGDALVGTVKIGLVDRGEDRGAYTLHRRFERAP